MLNDMQRQMSVSLREFFRPVTQFLREMMGVAMMGVGLTTIAMADLAGLAGVTVLLVAAGLVMLLLGVVMSSTRNRDDRTLRERIRQALDR